MGALAVAKLAAHARLARGVDEPGSAAGAEGDRGRELRNGVADARVIASAAPA
jgi:hypothetical protein